MKLDLASRIKRPSRRPITLPNVAPTRAQEDDLAAIYRRVIAAWIAGIPAIIAEYERTLGELRIDSAATTTGAIDGVEAEIRGLVLTLSPDLRRWALNVERVMTGKWARNVLSATAVDLSTVLSPDDMNETVEAALNWNTALIRDVSDELRRKVANAVFAGFQRRAPASEIAKELREATGLARARSLRIAADQSVKLGARLNRARQEQAGLTSFVWVHSGKAHPRLWHRARNGKTFRWDDPKLAADLPGYAPFCGCTGRGVVTFGVD